MPRRSDVNEERLRTLKRAIRSDAVDVSRLKKKVKKERKRMKALRKAISRSRVSTRRRGGRRRRTKKR